MSLHLPLYVWQMSELIVVNFLSAFGLKQTRRTTVPMDEEQCFIHVLASDLMEHIYSQ